MRIAEQRLGHGFHHASLSRAGRPQETQVSHKTARSVQPGQEHLVNFSDLFDGLVLTDNAAAQCGFKFSSVGAAAVRMENGSEVRSHKIVVCLVLPAFPGLFSSGSPATPLSQVNVPSDKFCH